MRGFVVAAIKILNMGVLKVKRVRLRGETTDGRLRACLV